MTNLHELTIADARALLDRGEITSVELIQALLDRIAVVENQVRAFVSITEEHALEQARAADQRKSEERRGTSEHPIAPLLGIPLGVKDVISTKGVTTTCGSKFLEHYVPPYDATVVTRLQAAGAVL